MRSDGSRAAEPQESADRAQTDENLRTERDNIDRVVAETQASVEDDADRVVDRARRHADAILVAARHKADSRLDEPRPTDDSDTALSEERKLEDEVLRHERSSADERLRHEREHSTRVLLALLPLERDATDQYLLTERVRLTTQSPTETTSSVSSATTFGIYCGAIVTAAGLLSEMAADTDDRVKARRGAERINRYAARMNRLIGDLVDVASIDAGRLSVRPGPGDVAALIADAVETFQCAARAKELSLAMRMTDRTLPAAFDYERMLQILANLITNAIKFTPSGGSILVHGERLPDAVRLSVSDTGGGISP